MMSGVRITFRIWSDTLLRRLLKAVDVRTTSLVDGSAVVSKKRSMFALAIVNWSAPGARTGIAPASPPDEIGGAAGAGRIRSEERRVGEGGRSRGSPYH